MRNKYWSDKQIKLNEKKEKNEIKTENIVEENIVKKREDEKNSTVSEGEDDKFIINKYGRKIKKINYKI